MSDITPSDAKINSAGALADGHDPRDRRESGDLQTFEPGSLEEPVSDDEIVRVMLGHGKKKRWEPAVGTTAGQSSLQRDETSSHHPTRLEFDLFLHTLYNVNDSLRLQMTLSGGMMAACVTMLNVFGPTHTGNVVGFVDALDRYVFIPAMVSIVISYFGLEHHWNYRKRKAKPPEQMDELYSMVAFKYKMLHTASVFLVISAVLLGLFILVDFG